jgi:hypothetical protein
MARGFVAALALALMLASLPVNGQGAELHHAAVVVRHGNGGLTYALVAFPEESINGAELLKRAKLGAVTVEFGGLGEAVCIIEKEGCPPSVCQKKVCQTGAADSPFWHFYQLDSAGTWQFTALGASSAKVRDGDVTGWSWTGTDANLPAMSFAALEQAAPEQPNANGISIWRSGPAQPSESRQSTATYLGAAAVLILALAAAAFVMLRKRRLAPARDYDDG